MISLFLEDHYPVMDWLTTILLSIALVYNLYFILPYFSIKPKTEIRTKHQISLLSSNVHQENDQYSRLIALVKSTSPDILLTMETNKTWEKALQPVENSFKSHLKIPLENKYGMHFYTNLKVHELNKRYLISEKYPSIEATLSDQEGHQFKFWGIHPPPPSPTEKPTSKVKDAELMLLAKRLKNEKLPVIVAGDFNNVCWSKTSKLFSKVSGLKDARLGRGIYGTFPAYAYVLRFPLDLVFNSTNLNIHKIKTLPSINSDHLPVLVNFSVKHAVRTANMHQNYDSEKVKQTIKEGIKAKHNDH